MKSKVLFWLLKAAIASITAFFILNMACLLYYNIPIHFSSDTGSTDYVWQKNKFYLKGVEGYAWGVTDKNGFNNLKTFNTREIDVLLMGSSHMEAFNVPQEKNTAAVLNKLSKDRGISLNTYNIGVSAHNFAVCLNNLENALNEFKPRQYVVIETQNIRLTENGIVGVLEDTLPSLESHNTGIIGTLQKSPYLRLLYSQLENVLKNNKTGSNPVMQNEKDDTHYYILLNELIKKCSLLCDKSGVELIIFYNCKIDFDDKGQIIKQKDIDDVEGFKNVCDQNGVTFINMYDTFKAVYDTTNKLPRGFFNTKVGEGHLNEVGHRAIAEKLFSVITE